MILESTKDNLSIFIKCICYLSNTDIFHVTNIEYSVKGAFEF